MRHPVLVASTDGVGTKVKLAAQAGRYHSIGQDIVNHCINDILVQGARPLFFLDYFATSALAARDGGRDCQRHRGSLPRGRLRAARRRDGRDAGRLCRRASSTWPGPSSALVEREHILPRPDLRPGDVLVGLRSSGPHTNGYSLIRRVFDGVPLDTVFPELGVSLADALLAPHRSYLPLLRPLLEHPEPAGQGAGAPHRRRLHRKYSPRAAGWAARRCVQGSSWPVPPLFNLIQQRGGVCARGDATASSTWASAWWLIVARENVATLRAA